jgi:hypothetical protein
VVYGVSFAAAAAIASSPSEFLGVMRGSSIEALFVIGFVVGFGCRPGTGLRRRGMIRFGGEEEMIFPNIGDRALVGTMNRCTSETYSFKIQGLIAPDCSVVFVASRPTPRILDQPKVKGGQ